MGEDRRNRRDKDADTHHPESISTEGEDQMIKELAELTVVTLQDNHQNETDFDEYAKLLRSRVFQDLKNFTTRFVKGYKVLLEGLHEKNNHKHEG